MVKNKTERHHAVDALRVLAILAVVAIHTSTRTIEAVNGNIDSLPFSFLINQVSRFAVPLFFLISGYVLELSYPKHQNYFVYLKKRFNRIFLPYVAWSAFYYVVIYPIHNVNFIDALVGGNASYQLYFIPTLLIFYSIFPLLHEIYRVLSNKFVLILLIVLQLFLLSRDYYVHPLPIFYPLDIALLNYVFFVIGMVASHNQNTLFRWTKKYAFVLLFLLFASGYAVTHEARNLYTATHNYLDYYSSWRPSILVYTLIFASFFYFIFDKTKRFQKIAHKLSQLSFFVFFVHVAVLESFWNLVGKQLFENMQTSVEKAVYLVLFFGIVTGVSYSLAFLVHKMPHVSKITG